jgi:hypothetical protein
VYCLLCYSSCGDTALKVSQKGFGREILFFSRRVNSRGTQLLTWIARARVGLYGSRQCGLSALRSAWACATCRACESSAGVRLGNVLATVASSAGAGTPVAMSLVMMAVGSLVSGIGQILVLA